MKNFWVSVENLLSFGWKSSFQNKIDFNGFKCKENVFFSCNSLCQEFFLSSFFLSFLPGGWTQIANIITLDKQSFRLNQHAVIPPLNFEVTHDKSYALTSSALNDFILNINATQLRIYCYKPATGRRVHIVTKNTTIGRNVLNYFANVDDSKLPTAVNSFDVLPDDTSFLSKNVEKWRLDNGEWGNSVYSNNPLK